MATTSGLMTVDEARSLPEPTDGAYYELHYGELVRLAIPKLPHQLRQKRIEKVLERKAGHRGLVMMELDFALSRSSMRGGPT